MPCDSRYPGQRCASTNKIFACPPPKYLFVSRLPAVSAALRILKRVRQKSCITTSLLPTFYKICHQKIDMHLLLVFFVAMMAARSIFGGEMCPSSSVSPAAASTIHTPRPTQAFRGLVVQDAHVHPMLTVPESSEYTDESAVSILNVQGIAMGMNATLPIQGTNASSLAPTKSTRTIAGTPVTIIITVLRNNALSSSLILNTSQPMTGFTLSCNTTSGILSSTVASIGSPSVLNHTSTIHLSRPIPPYHPLITPPPIVKPPPSPIHPKTTPHYSVLTLGSGSSDRHYGDPARTVLRNGGVLSIIIWILAVIVFLG